MISWANNQEKTGLSKDLKLTTTRKYPHFISYDD